MDQLDHLDNEKIIDVDIEQKMKKSYLLYSMSVIVSRALPDVRDGLKPVHRRIIYAMDNLKIGPRSPYRKSATVVGDVLGKYHPHSDTSVYDAMVRLAQEFNMRYPLVDGHGNFGSVDGDSAAAMRYTEVRMTSLTLELLRDIEKNTIDYDLNFDETLEEPKVLPSRFPNLLVNGSSGIAVGMATNIPPHNLGEVIDGITMLIDNKDVTIDELMTAIKGPDFPTGGSIMGMKGVYSAYKTGRGRVLLRAVTHIEELDRGRSRIVITELPYQVNKARLIEKIAEYVRDKRLEGITDIKDESDKDGTRVTIDVSRDANPQIVLNNLYKYTQLQTTFGVIMLALVDNEPVVLNLKQILEHYLAHQVDIITRRTNYDLDRAEKRAHIVEGLKIALDNVDNIIKIIRGSYEDSEAEKILIEKYELSKEQTKAILDMTLRRLTGLEKGKLDSEYEELNKTINEYREILGNEDLILNIIKKDLIDIKEKFSDDRRTDFKPYYGDIDVADMIDEEDVVLTLTRHGYIKRMPQDMYKTQNRGGRGVLAMSTRDDDFVENLYITSTHDTILFFTNKGKTYSMKAFEIPESGRQARGTPIVNLLDLEKGEKITAMLPIEEEVESENLVFATKQGLVKRVDIDKFKNIRSNGLISITLNDDDELIDVKKTEDKKDIILVTQKGKAIRFAEDDVNIYGRQAKGVIGIRLEGDDEVVSMGLADDDKDLFVISKYGFGKRTSMKEYRPQGRGGRGVLTYNIQERTGDIVSAKVLDENDEIMIITKNGIMIRINTKDISQIGRNTRGVTLIRTDNDEVVAVARHYESEDDEEEIEKSEE